MLGGAVPRRSEIPNNKHRPARPEIPNNKHQISNKHQIRRTEIQNPCGLPVTLSLRGCVSRVRTVAPPALGLFWSLEFGVLNLFGICNLVLGILRQ